MRGVQWILLIFAIVEIALLLFVAGTQSAAWPLSRLLGAWLLMFAVAWIAVARYQLGGSFSVMPKARRLVTNGLYRRLRHPIYVASPFFLVGLALVLRRWWPFVLGAFITPVQIVRARREDAVLRAAFGAEYDQYREETWF
jgi:protein-S-isoprenylcysteine O-methyltransferase Ste14